MTRPSLLFFCPRLGGGGGEKHFARLMAGLAGMPFDLHYVASCGGGDYEPLLGPQIRKTSLGIRARSSTRRLLRSVAPLADVIRRERPDYVFSVLDAVNFAAAAAIRLSGAQTRHVQLVQTSPRQQRLHRGGLAPRIVDGLYPIFYSSRSDIVCLSSGVAQEIRSRLPSFARSRIHTVHNIVVPPEEFVTAGDVGSGRADRDPDLVVCCGRLVELKGFDVAIRAFSRIASSRAAARLRIVGDGPCAEELRRLAHSLGVGERVELTGRVSDPESHFRRAAVLVLSSHFEGFGNVLVEAMACGAAVIATDCPYGPGEIVTHGVTGLLVRPGDPDGMAAAIGELLADRGLRDRVALAGWRRAADFLPEKIVGEYCRVVGLPIDDRLDSNADHLAAHEGR